MGGAARALVRHPARTPLTRRAGAVRNEPPGGVYAYATPPRPMAYVNPGFRGRRRPEIDPARVPPGQYVTDEFPVLSAGPTPRVDTARWRLAVGGAVTEPREWTWGQFRALPAETYTEDIHCVTKWSKLDTTWEGVSVDTLFDGVELADGLARDEAFVLVHAVGGYTTNLALADLLGGRAFVAFAYDGAPLPPDHGGPARLVVPHLYFWKSAKWVTGFEVLPADERGFWERLGYHNHGDPWAEERYG